MPYSIDFKVENTNAENVDVEIELTDLAEEISPLFYEFTDVPTGISVFTCDNIPDGKYFDGTVRFKPRGASQFLDSLPISVDRFRTDEPIINLSLTADTGAGGENSFDITLPPTLVAVNQPIFIDAALDYDTPVAAFGNFVPLPIPIDPNNTNYLWDYELIPESGLTGDQTELVFDEQASSATEKVYEVTTVTNEEGTIPMRITLKPFKEGETGGSSIFDEQGVRIEFSKPVTQTPTYDFSGAGEFQLRFELFIKGTDDPNWDSLNTYTGIRNDATYLSSFDPQVTIDQLVQFEITTTT